MQEALSILIPEAPEPTIDPLLLFRLSSPHHDGDDPRIPPPPAREISTSIMGQASLDDGEQARRVPTELEDWQVTKLLESFPDVQMFLTQGAESWIRHERLPQIDEIPLEGMSIHSHSN